MNRTTGMSIGGIDHLVQSIREILFTRTLTRVVRRAFGSGLPELIDAPITPSTISAFYSAIVVAIMRWEPRIVVARVYFTGGKADASKGKIGLNLQGFWRENGAPLQVVVPL